MTRAVLTLGLLGGTFASAHDFSADFIGNFARATANTPRSGSVGGALTPSFDLSDAWNVWGTFAYTRDLATRAGDTSSPGSNAYSLLAGALWTPNDHWAAGLTFSLAPKVKSQSAASYAVGSQAGSALIESTNGSQGVSLSGSYNTSGFGFFQSGVDVSVSYSHYDIFQQAFIENPTVAASASASCSANPSEDGCRLLKGASTPLNQLRLGATYTATLGDTNDLGLDGAVYVFDQDPTKVGYFSVAMLGEVGSGAPAAPYLFTLRPFYAHRFERWSLRVAYQLGVYQKGGGINQVLSARATVRVSKAVRLTFMLSGQADRSTVTGDDGTSTVTASNRSLTVTVGGMWLF